MLGALAAFALAACEPATTVVGRDISPVDISGPVAVALLVPSSATGGAGSVGQSMENAAQLAAADVQGAEIDLRVYDTGGTPGGAVSAVDQALSEGAQIVLGPLYSQSISAVTPRVASAGVNVLAFSNNTAVAGGNVFVLGQTFDNVAQRLTAYAAGQGRNSVAVVHSDDVGGNTGREAIVDAAQTNGMRVATVQSYPLSQQGILEAGPRIADAIEESDASSVFLTANVDTDLPLIARTLPDNGVDPAQVRYLGLTRWNALDEALRLPGLQGGLFALPDQSAVAAFESRYRAAYGDAPHPLAGLAFDGVQAVASLVASGRPDPLNAGALTQPAGFEGAYGAFRLLPDGTNNRALAVAQVQNNQVVVLDPAPQSFGAAGF